MLIRELECPLQVSVVNEHGFSASSVIYGCVLEIFGVPYPIDLIHIPMGDVCMIVGMDRLSRFGVMIDCEGQCVIVQTPSGGELVIYWEDTRMGSGFCSTARSMLGYEHSNTPMVYMQPYKPWIYVFSIIHANKNFPRL